MADLVSQSSFLPTVKCSLCAREIPISMMGDHVCGATLKRENVYERDAFNDKSLTRATAASPPDLFTNKFDSMSQGQYENRTGRMAPPRVDTSAANRPFFRHEEMTPVSAFSDPVVISPPGQYHGRAPSFGKPPRGARGAVRSPSPEDLSPNNDSAFPPFPRPNSKGYNTKGRHDNKGDRMYPPMSPNLPSSAGVMQRMNMMKPGPFDVSSTQNARLGTSSAQAQGGQGDGFRNRSGDNEGRGHVPQPSSNSGFSVSSTSTSATSPEKKPPSRMPRLDRTGGYGGFGPPVAQEYESFEPPLLETKRSMTVPIAGNRAAASMPRRPSEASNTSKPRLLSRSDHETNEHKYGGVEGKSLSKQARWPSEDRTMPLPSEIGIKMETLAAEFSNGNPYHAPSESQSSYASSRSAMSTTSSHSSPPWSSQTTLSRRKPSDTTALDGVMSEIHTKLANAVPKGPSNVMHPPQLQFAESMLARRLDPSLLSPESPMDPAIRDGRLSPLSTQEPSETVAEKVIPPPKESSETVIERVATPLSAPQRPPSTTKGDCRGCGEPIKGKSISSADGRLTGRYHKQCFTCKTCSEPFPTSEFYVIDDAPYCEQHYHKLNNSLCEACDKGIEGEYLETESKQKYHPKCLTCSDCRRILRDEYFDMNGHVYCERDANRKAQQRNFLTPETGTNKVERRTTRLMMI